MFKKLALLSAFVAAPILMSDTASANNCRGYGGGFNSFRAPIGPRAVYVPRGGVNIYRSGFSSRGFNRGGFGVSPYNSFYRGGFGGVGGFNNGFYGNRGFNRGGFGIGFGF